MVWLVWGEMEIEDLKLIVVRKFVCGYGKIVVTERSHPLRLFLGFTPCKCVMSTIMLGFGISS